MKLPLGRKHRDLSFIDLNSEDMLVIACDSCGGVGDKEKDIVKVKPEIVGYYTAQVALMEVLAIGAKPMVLVNNLSVEMANTGKEILKGINKVLASLNLERDIIITGSTEENFPMCQTAMGVTVIGNVHKSTWTLPKTIEGNLAVVVGIPKVGEEVLLDFGRETISVSVLEELVRNKNVNEIVPVGSKGILYELSEMAETNGLHYVLIGTADIDLTKSAGPSTCAIISINQEDLHQLKEEISLPINVIGKFATKTLS